MRRKQRQKPFDASHAKKAHTRHAVQQKVDTYFDQNDNTLLGLTLVGGDNDAFALGGIKGMMRAAAREANCSVLDVARYMCKRVRHPFRMHRRYVDPFKGKHPLHHWFEEVRKQLIEEANATAAVASWRQCLGDLGVAPAPIVSFIAQGQVRAGEALVYSNHTKRVRPASHLGRNGKEHYVGVAMCNANNSRVAVQLKGVANNQSQIQLTSSYGRNPHGKKR